MLAFSRGWAISGNGQQAAVPFDEAWKALRADKSVQFDLTPAPPPPQTPEWLEALGRFLKAIFQPIGRFFSWLFSWLPEAAYARGLLIALIVAGALLLIWMIVVRLRDGGWAWPWRRSPKPTDEQLPEMAWQPEEAPARQWLDEADALARQGRFAEAVHCLLLRSVEDMARRNPNAVRPATTSRELARCAVLPARARSLFSQLAEAVERSFFGGRTVGDQGWAKAREAYAQFALPGAWRP